MRRTTFNKNFLVFALIVSAITTHAQEVDSLQHYLRIAANNNHSLKSEFNAYEASLQKIPQAGAFSDPQLEIGIFLKPMDIIDGGQVADFKLMQMFPWFGTRKAARTEAQHMSKMAYEKFRETRDNLYFGIYNQWFILCNLQQRLLNTQANKVILTHLEELALRKFSSSNAGPSSKTNSLPSTSSAPFTTNTSGGTGVMNMGGAQVSQVSQVQQMSMSGGNSGMGVSSSGMSDVLRIQLEIAELDNNILSIKSEMVAAKAKFNALLSRPANENVVIPDTFEKLPFIYDNEESTFKRIMENNPMLKMISEESLVYKAKGEMDRKMSYPMFGIGINYSVINKRMDDEMGLPVTSMNGKDMIMPMISVNLPIFRKKYNAQQKESKLYWQSSHEKYANTQKELEAQYYMVKHQIGDADRKIELFTSQSKLAQTTYSIIIQEFISGKSDLTNVMQVQRMLLEYQLKRSEAIAEYNTMIASLQRLISTLEKE